MMAQVGRGGHVRLAEFAVSRLRGAISDTLLTLRSGLGPVWEKTAVLCMTEFGRTARENGTRGTDHGTGGALLYAGGALRGGQVGEVLRGMFGLNDNVITGSIFPGVEMPAPLGIVRGV